MTKKQIYLTLCFALLFGFLTSSNAFSAADIFSDVPLLPDEYTILCVPLKVRGFGWEKGDWVAKSFKPGGQKLLVKSDTNNCKIYGDFSDDDYNSGTVAKKMCA